MNPYDKLLARKRTWTPVKTSKGFIKDEAQDVIKRALSVRHL